MTLAPYSKNSTVGDKKDFKFKNTGAAGVAVQEVHASSRGGSQQTNFNILGGRVSELQKEKKCKKLNLEPKFKQTSNKHNRNNLNINKHKHISLHL